MQKIWKDAIIEEKKKEGKKTIQQKKKKEIRRPAGKVRKTG